MKKGFTLIELLVVISIIALLASVVIGSLQKARIKANNAAISQRVVEYANAIELARNQNNSYPIATSEVCLGTYPSVIYVGLQCGFLNYSRGSYSPSLKSNLSIFIPSYPPVSNKAIPIEGAMPSPVADKFMGATYKSTNGQEATITWVLAGTNQICARRAQALTSFELIVNGSTYTITDIKKATVCRMVLN